ncbi:hypothetical protein BS17DRAFT_879796 [Gyrodon lividus]|nr:hypothetical protein BS17DRAFT_879796 [Gyrodon lividus]
MQLRLVKELLVLSALAFLTRAEYLIDDQNYTSLLYSENPGGAKWGPFQEGGETLSISLANGTMMTIDSSQCYNFTYTYAACTLADDCQVQIPFTGSGITIYVLQAGAQGINASLTIDGGTPKYNVLSAPPGPNFYIPNVTLFSVQGITTGNHMATMTVQNWDNIFSGMMFDYAAINETIVSPTTTSSSVTSSAAASTTSSVATSPAPASSTTPHVNISALVSGVIGGLVALVAIILAILCFRRRRRGNRDNKPTIEPFVPADVQQQRNAEWYSNPLTLQTTSPPTGLPTSRSQERLTSSASSPPPRKSQMGIMDPNTNTVIDGSLSSRSQTSPSSNGYSADSSEPSRPRRIQQTHPMLTDDQADFVNNLYTNNVPAAAIARVIERMMAGERRPAVEGYARGYLQPEQDHRHDSLPPPSYDHVTGGD